MKKGIAQFGVTVWARAIRKRTSDEIDLDEALLMLYHIEGIMSLASSIHILLYLTFSRGICHHIKNKRPLKPCLSDTLFAFSRSSLTCETVTALQGPTTAPPRHRGHS